jgi:hypothetical protein
MLNDFTTWLLGLVAKAFTAFGDLASDILMHAVGGILGGLTTLLGMIVVPGFIQTGLQGFWVNLDPGVGYYIGAVGLPQALGMIGTAYGVRLTRKLLTLFQW